MFNPHFEKAYQMVQNLTSKHVGELSACKLDWQVLELIHPSGEIIQQPVPMLLMDFK